MVQTRFVLVARRTSGRNRTRATLHYRGNYSRSSWRYSINPNSSIHLSGTDCTAWRCTTTSFRTLPEDCAGVRSLSLHSRFVPVPTGALRTSGVMNNSWMYSFLRGKSTNVMRMAKSSATRASYSNWSKSWPIDWTSPSPSFHRPTANGELVWLSAVGREWSKCFAWAK